MPSSKNSHISILNQKFLKSKFKKKFVYFKMQNIAIKTFSWTNSQFNTTSTLIFDKNTKEGILFDAQFDVLSARYIVSYCKEKDINISLLFITYSDPDFYFGANEIIKAFPGIEYAAHPQTVFLIKSSYKDKIKEWDYKEKVLIPESYKSKIIQKLGLTFNIVQYKQFVVVVCEKLKVIISGNLIYQTMHWWFADIDNINDIEEWLANIRSLFNSYNIDHIIPGHSLRFDINLDKKAVIDYFELFIHACKLNNNPSIIIDIMEDAFPYKNKETLIISVKNILQLIKRKKYRPFPPIAKEMYVDFKIYKFKLFFLDEKIMKFININYPYNSDTVTYIAKEVSPKTFMVYWNEPKNKSKVLHVQNWTDKLVWTNIIDNLNNETHLEGKIIL